MRLTDATQIKLISGDTAVAVFEPGKTALVIDVRKHASNLFTCNWLYEAGYSEDGDMIVRECGAVAVEFDNGFACTAGHDHRNDCDAGYMLASNARII